MRRLVQPQIVTAAILAAALSAALSLPRMLLWARRPFPVWYLEATILLGGFCLWAFVFAWHTEYTRRPVFTLKMTPALFMAATVAGVLAATGFHFFLDPAFRAITPQDYPADFPHWLASTLFALAFAQLFLIYAPFAWCIRLFRNQQIATWLTVSFNVLVLIMKIHSSPTPPPHLVFLELLVLRIALGFSAVWFYLRGGILLVSWLGFLIEIRHLFGFH